MPFWLPASSICLFLLPGASLPFAWRLDFLPLLGYSTAGDAEAAVLAPPVLSTEAYAGALFPSAGGAAKTYVLPCSEANIDCS